MTRYYVFSLLLSLSISLFSSAQTGYINQDFTWQEKSVMQFDSSKLLIPYTATSQQVRPDAIPVYSFQIPIENNQELKLNGAPFYMMEALDPEKFSAFQSLLNPAELKASTNENFVRVYYEIERKQKIAIIEIPMMELDGHLINKITHVTLKYEITENNQFTPNQFKKAVTWKSESLLKTGSWAKVIFSEDGIYRLSAGDVNGLGIGAAGQEVSKIRMYAYAGGMLPEANALTVYDDLEEMAITVRDKNNNGIFDGDDDILFYVNGPNALQYDAANGTYKRQIHYYSTLAAAYITVGNPGGKRISAGGSNPGTPTYTTSSFDEIIHLEEEKYNLIRSGRDWYGKEFGRTVTQHTMRFEIVNPANGEPAILQTRATARCEYGSAISATANGQQIHQHPFSGLGLLFYEYSAPYASEPTVLKSSFTANGPIDITFNYNRPTADAKAWIDYAEVVYRRKLETNGQLLFRDARGVSSNGVTRFNLSGTGWQIWDITDPLNAFTVSVQSDNGNEYFIANSSILRRYAAYRGEDFRSIISTEIPANQNIHGNRNVDYVIVSHPEFIGEANRLADFHRQQNGLNVLVVQPFEVYNEFSSGVPDITAYRNMMRYFYETAAPGKEPKYFLLFGDASYDYKNITKENTNFLPTWETPNSIAPVGSYCTDDFFGLLDESEGVNLDYSGKLDLGIGRFPVQNVTSARQMVDKVIRYHDPKGLGDWRNNIVLLTDDEDNNIHMHDGMAYAKIVEDNYEEYNVRKVYSDAYKQETVGNGQRYPDVVKEVNRAFNDGALIVNYSGHGGEVQLGAEKFVEIPQINSWSGGERLPLFITATCEFSRFDDPARQSAGELVLLNPNGGSIGLLTTVRLVYQWPNLQLNKNFYIDNAFSYAPDQVPAVGDLMRKTKNETTPSVNNRSFAYLGDPAVKLAYPKYHVVATEINATPIGSLDDTLNALSNFTLTGEVQDFQNAKLSNFTGTVNTTIFAPAQDVTTLANDQGSYEETYKAYTSIIYKGKASVVNGEFSFNFILPRDLPYEIGNAKISFYASDGTEDANGYEYFKLSPKIDVNAIPDQAGPEIRLFMNDSFFVRGGITDENPHIYALIYDESGINTTGLGIGRDISGVLDNDNKELIVLNEYYDANIDDFQRGVVYYPLTGLAEGEHSLTVKVWDVYNNSATATTNFIVSNRVEFVIDKLMAYPNPFYQSTTISFEHNQTGKILDMRVLIYDSQGNLVKTLTATELATGSRMNSLVWNPYRGGYSELAPGVYHFKLVVKNEEGKEVEASSRLVYMPNP